MRPIEQAVATFAKAEGAGVLTTIGTTASDGRWHAMLPRRMKAARRGRPYDVQSDGRVYERFGEEPTAFYLFGAGHVGRALTVALAPLPFAVTWIDARPGAIPAEFPGKRDRDRARAIRPNCSRARRTARSSP